MVSWFRSPRARKIHRWLGVGVALYVLMASASGLIHMAMANAFPPPPPVAPQGSVALEKATLPLSRLASHGPVRAVNLRSIDGALWYQLLPEKGKPLYADAATGEWAELDAVYALQIAQAHLRRSGGVAQTAYLTAFDSQYLNIFRVLPVYRFETAEGERVYVSTVTGSVTHYLNPARAFSQASFSYLHKLAFIPNKAARDAIQAALVVAVIAVTVMGLGLFLSRRRGA